MAIDVSNIQIGEFQILESSIIVNPEASDSFLANSVSIQFESSGVDEAEEGLMQLAAQMTVESKPEDDSNGGFASKVVARGIFLGKAFEDSDADREFELFMKMNAYSLLYGYIRNHVQQVSSLTPARQINLPCVDFQSIARTIIESEESD